MPELAEVEITRRKLLPLVRGRKILDFWTDWERGFKPADSVKRAPHKSLRDYTGQVADSIRGRKILDVTRRGKVIFFKLSPWHGSGQAGRPERMLAIHLGMSGRLAVASQHTAERHPERSEGSPGILRPDVPSGFRITEEPPARWTHFLWRLSGGRELRFVDPRKFGRVWYGSLQELNCDKYLGRLGRDARSLSFTEFSAILGNNNRAMIKPFLLRQDRFAGIGNIIADESLWQAKIHPRTVIAALTQLQRRQLFHGIQKTIRAMLSSGGTSLRNWGHPDGRTGGYQKRRLIYGKAGESCPRCRRKLKRIIIGGRGTTLCPRCQQR